jgi:hypothetical protein
MDPRRPKNQSSQNQKKPVKLHLSRCTDSIHIIFFTNGPRMQKLSCSNRFPKQTKNQLVKVKTSYL